MIQEAPPQGGPTGTANPRGPLMSSWGGVQGGFGNQRRTSIGCWFPYPPKVPPSAGVATQRAATLSVDPAQCRVGGYPKDRWIVRPLHSLSAHRTLAKFFAGDL